VENFENFSVVTSVFAAVRVYGYSRAFRSRSLGCRACKPSHRCSLYWRRRCWKSSAWLYLWISQIILLGWVGRDLISFHCLPFTSHPTDPLAPFVSLRGNGRSGRSAEWALQPRPPRQLSPPVACLMSLSPQNRLLHLNFEFYHKKHLSKLDCSGLFCSRLFQIGARSLAASISWARRIGRLIAHSLPTICLWIILLVFLIISSTFLLRFVLNLV
jgi:hypothetical protein